MPQVPIPNTGSFRPLEQYTSGITIPSQIDIAQINKTTRDSLYEDSVKKYRREKNLPDPFSNMSFAADDDGICLGGFPRAKCLFFEGRGDGINNGL